MRLLGLMLILLGWTAAAQPPVEEIMRKVAESQDRAAESRKSIVYRQDTWVRLMRTNGKLSREEKRQYTVLPKESSSEKTLDKFEGRYEKSGKIFEYDKPHFQYKDLDIDGDLIEDLTEDLVNDENSRDGISKDLFPLTRDEQRKYSFKLAGTQKVHGVDAWRIQFEPKKGHDIDDAAWAGEVLVHPEEFQPMVVTTRLSFHIPVAVKVTLGTDIKQLGFNVTYQKVADGLWFPATYGTEFGLKVLFGYKRNITMNVKNSDFRRATSESRIAFDEIR